MAGSVNILITGCNRGIGKALTAVYVSRPRHNVVAAVRDPDSPSSKALHDLPRGEDSKVILVKVNSASETDAIAAVEVIKADHAITKLDLVIANAGISKYFGKAAVTPAKEMLDHFRINSVGPLLLFQATAPLLAASDKPKFVAVSSGAGSIGGMDKLPVENTAYGSSKAALNFVTRKIHFENPHLISFSVNPGWLQTDLGNHAAISAGITAAPTTVLDGVSGIIEKIDNATKEGTSGRFLAWDGEELSW